MWLGGHQLRLRCHLLLLHSFKWFKIKAATADYPVTQKEVDELLGKSALEASTGSAAFYSNVFVVPKYTDGS